jgi:hypothetical protein
MGFYMHEGWLAIDVDRFDEYLRQRERKAGQGKD